MHERVRRARRESLRAAEDLLGIPRLALREVAERLEAFARPRDADGHVRAAVRVERQAPLGIGLLAHSGGMQRAEELPERLRRTRRARRPRAQRPRAPGPVAAERRRTAGGSAHRARRSAPAPAPGSAGAARGRAAPRARGRPAAPLSRGAGSGTPNAPRPPRPRCPSPLRAAAPTRRRGSGNCSPSSAWTRPASISTSASHSGTDRTYREPAAHSAKLRVRALAAGDARTDPARIRGRLRSSRGDIDHGAHGLHRHGPARRRRRARPRRSVRDRRRGEAPRRGDAHRGALLRRVAHRPARARSALGAPIRLLGIGLPLTIVLGFLAALALLGDLALAGGARARHRPRAH